MKYQDCFERLLVLGTVDWIGAWEVASVAQTVGGATSEAAVRDLSLRVIADLLNRGLMEAGDVTESGFRPWTVPVAAAVSRIQREWTALGRNPDLGDICWLANTKAGDVLGRQLSETRR
jgi:hypothetical protein